MLLFSLCCFVFFFKQKTAYEVRISDWSSDVCSSDLLLDGRVRSTQAELATWQQFAQPDKPGEPRFEVRIDQVAADEVPIDLFGVQTRMCSDRDIGGDETVA